MNSAWAGLSGLDILALGDSGMRAGICRGTAIVTLMVGSGAGRHAGPPSPTAGLIETFLVQLLAQVDGGASKLRQATSAPRSSATK
jgi:hypothetical protein